MSEPSNTLEILSPDLPDFTSGDDFKFRGLELDEVYAVLLYELARSKPRRERHRKP